MFISSLNKINGQKIGYVDSKFLLENNAEYIESKKYMKAELNKWNAQLDSLNNGFEKEYKEFLNEKILLTTNQITKVEKDLEEKKKKIAEFEKQKFGPDGELIKSQLTIINPIQNKIWSAVQTISKRRGLTIVLDKASESGMLIIYSDPRYDITPSVLDYINDPNKKKKPKVKTDKIKKEVKESDFDINDEKNDLILESDSLKVEKNINETKKEIKLEDKPKLPIKKTKTLSDKIKEIEKNQINK
ncbi:MAG: OmpH family outer membrane protein [Solirubrobacteraceae bacterium]